MRLKNGDGRNNGFPPSRNNVDFIAANGILAYYEKFYTSDWGVPTTILRNPIDSHKVDFNEDELC